MEDEEKAAIDTGESYNPEPEGPPAPPQSGQLSAIPDVGAPPIGEVAQTSAMGGLRKLGSQVAGDIGKGVDNLAASLPGRIVSYVLGAGGDHPQLLDEEAAKFIAQGANKDQANVLAAANAGDEDKQFKRLQGHRQYYNHAQSMAKVALEGSPDKPADFNAAIYNANQATPHILDGSTVQFAPAPGGVVANVTSAEGQTQQLPLGMKQFAQWLDVGKDGLWDRVMDYKAGGAAAVLNNLSKQSQAAQPTSYGRTPSSVDWAENDRVRPPTGGPPDPTDARSRKIFPNISQETQRQQWIAGQESQSAQMQNKVDVAREGADAKRDVQNTRSESNEKVAGIQADVRRETVRQKLAQEAAKLEARKEDRAAQEKGKTLRALIGSPNFLTMAEKDYKAMFEKAGVPYPAPSGEGAPPPAGGAPPPAKAGGQGQPPEPGARFFKGQWYRRGPDGVSSVPIQ